MSNKSQPKPDRDTLFLIENGNRDFTFDSKTAGVFDDMVQRSVPFFTDFKFRPLTASFGVAAFPDDARTKSELIRFADEAMYLVKNTARDGIAVANHGMLS